MSPNNSEYLTDANDVHIVNWGSTGMAGFLNACTHASSCIAHTIMLFLDVMVNE